MTMDIPPYISVSILSNPNFNCSQTTDDDTPQTSPRETKKPETTSITIVPKKRSFDVAFLISSDDDYTRKSSNSSEEQHSPNENFRSAFTKVGLGVSKFPESRTPSPIDPIRTPSPAEPPRRPHRMQVPPETMFYPFTGIFPPRLPKDEKPEKNYGFLNPVPRNSFLPSPIFGANTMVPTSFMAASLLPPSLTALSLPAQNICAKCNVSFRMTSDLVYHMRSHHKNDHTSPEQLRRRKELEKLKCPVCNESFRERHHLTRHMTAHQDKAGDNLENGDRTRLKYPSSSIDYRH